MDSSPGSSIHGMGRVPNSSSLLSRGMLVSRTARRLLTRPVSWGESSTTRPFGPHHYRPLLSNLASTDALNVNHAGTTPAMQDGVGLIPLHFLYELTSFQLGLRHSLDPAPLRVR